jgi:predicted Fe-Mo cluster-binding NifX family protein
MVKIVIPAADESGATLSGHFGRAPYYAWYQVKNGKVVEKGVVPNDSDHFGGEGSPPEKIMSLGAEIVISAGMGMKAINIFQQSTVAVLKGTYTSSEENIQEFIEGNLIELTEGCLHGHDH